MLYWTFLPIYWLLCTLHTCIYSRQLMCFPTSDVVTAAPDYMGERGAVPPVQHWHGMADTEDMLCMWHILVDKSVYKMYSCTYLII